MKPETLKKLEIDEENIVIRCVADNKSELIIKAVLNGWKQCKTCSYPICNECLTTYLAVEEGTNPVCPGSYVKGNHVLVLETIPTELILIEARKIPSQLPPIGLLLDRAFYSNPLAVKDDKHQIDAYFHSNSVYLAKQEKWANMGSVIVKRNHGKYISWEKLSNI